ncbi:hypothetical protein GCM10022237_09020 [Nocardioides ginsengisoli]
MTKTDTCRSCGSPMEPGKRRERLTCSNRCRARLSRESRADREDAILAMTLDALRSASALLPDG